ncbi:cytochrome P450 monooxygenase oxidoreductase [Fusarium pseudocircinatum]|uniref:Cytochrome P450 monooxygenase oxidoreductase n=1 Tax=Fusarium pseudocircinatum TaxID=56676 RepID=A0A8H5UTZ4_9HYPO|nr:cytochrome P450 monooxygenase oxidoreductase [Fusarium pseudocircinatum]
MIISRVVAKVVISTNDFLHAVEPDLGFLQCVRVCMKETLGWMPTTILGAVPHAVTQDDTYNAYLIPKGAGVLNNVWGIHMDPERHANPRQFNPDRYRDDFQSLADAAANPDASKRDQFTFGAGRRICPGIHVAERSLFLGISRILWAFNINPTVWIRTASRFCLIQIS